MLQDWLVVAPSSKFYTVSTVLFNKYVGANYGLTNFMSHFYMSVPNKANVKFSYGKTWHAQVIRILLCFFPNCPIIYPVGQVYYFPGHPSNTISLGDLKWYVGFKKVTSEPLEHFGFVDPQGCSWRSPLRTRNNLYYIQIKIVKVNPQKNRNIVLPTLCGLSKNNLYSLIHQQIGHVFISSPRLMARKLLKHFLPKQIPDLE